MSEENALLDQIIAEQEAELKLLQAQLADRETRLVRLRELASKNSDVSETAENESDYKIALALTLANAAYDALLVVDDQHYIIAINDSAEALFNVQRPIGQRLADVTGAPELEMMVSDALLNQEEAFEEQLFIDKRAYRVRTRVIYRQDHQFIGIALQDVTELVRLNRARREMVANISHELRTPIANIRLSIDSLFHEQDKPKRKASISALKSIARETDSLLWLVQELYDLSMIETGQAILRAVETPVIEIVNEAFERMEDLALEKDLHLVHHVLPDLYAIADRDQIRRVIINLIHNAIKYSPQGGVIEVDAVSEAQDVKISVIDQGPGVPEDHVQRIFERFYQVDAARTRGEGTGLGLAICKHIVEAHEGMIWAESNREMPGGRFFFRIPYASPPETLS